MAERFRYDLIPAGAAVLCALSGGRDSMYLLCRLLEGAESGGYTVRPTTTTGSGPRRGGTRISSGSSAACGGCR